MKKSYIFALVAVLAILGLGVAIKFSQKDESKDKPLINTETENPASAIGEGEVRLTNENFTKEIKEYKGVALVDMFSPSCSFCQKTGPVVSEVAKETQGKYKVGKLNVLVSPELAEEFKIVSVPALIFFKDGKEATRLVGAQDKATILAKLEEVSK